MINLAPALVKTERFHNNAYCTIKWSQSLSTAGRLLKSTKNKFTSTNNFTYFGCCYHHISGLKQFHFWVIFKI